MMISPPKQRPFFKRIPYDIIYDHARFNDYRVLFFLLLQKHTLTNSWEEQTMIYLNYSSAFKLIGITPDRHKNANIDQFRELINQLILFGDVTTSNISTSKDAMLIINPDSQMFYPKEHFAILYDFEIDFILKSWNTHSYSGIKPWKLLLVLSYLRLNINTRYGSAYNTKKNRERYPETYHQYYTNISDDLGLNQSTIAKCVDDLVEMGIIACKHTSGFKGSANLLTGRTIFANQYKYDLQQRGRLDSIYDYKKEIQECEGRLTSKRKQLKADKIYEHIEDDMELPFD